MNKAQSISINTIIIVAIALAVLVVLFAIFTGRLFPEEKISDEVVKHYYYTCTSSVVYKDYETDTWKSYFLPSNVYMGTILRRPQYVIDKELFYKLSLNSTKPVVCDLLKDTRKRTLEETGKQCKGENETIVPNPDYGDYPNDISVLCCWEEYCININESLNIIEKWDKCVCDSYDEAKSKIN